MEKPIEEMVCNACITKPTCTDMEKAKCMRRNFAICIIKQGYRKASDVAKEIFAEIERLLSANQSGEFRGDSVEWFDYFDLHLAEDIAELKKKYESEGGE